MAIPESFFTQRQHVAMYPQKRRTVAMITQSNYAGGPYPNTVPPNPVDFNTNQTL